MASIVVTGDTSGAITIAAPAVAGTNTLTLPASTGTLVVTGGAQTIEFADGSASAPSITNSGDTNTGMFFPAADTIAFTEGGTESMRIDSNGNVGIGVTSIPSDSRRVMQISNGTSGGILLLNNNASVDQNARVFSSVTNPTDLGFAAGGSTGFINYYTNGTERMRINASGQVTTPVQPAFQIVGSGSPSVTNGAVLPFSVALTNVGSHFNTSTYTFTVPVAGVYFFAISMRWENTNGSAGYWRPDFYINNTTNAIYTGALQATAANTYAYASQSFVVSLNAGDTCKWHYNTNGSATNNINMSESIFSGYLLG